MLKLFSYSILFFLYLCSHSIANEKIALIIGNGNYKNSPLSNPVNDANDMAEILENLNFTVIKKINANRAEMRLSIREFGDKLASSRSVGLFFYAGHGIQINGQNYLVPLNSNIEREDEIPDECLNASSVLRKMESAKNRLNIIILDACRDNPFKKSFRSSSRGLAEMQPPTGSIIAFATGPGSVAADGNGRNGLYTSKLLKHIKTPGLTIERVLKKVRIDVIKESNKKQVPWDLSSLTGDFYFQQSRGIKVVNQPKVAAIKIPEVKKPKVVESVEIENTDLLHKNKIVDSKPDYIISGRIDDFKNNLIYLELQLISLRNMRKVWVGQKEFKNKRSSFKKAIRNLIEEVQNDSWLSIHKRYKNTTPIIAVGKITNRSTFAINNRKINNILSNVLSNSTLVVFYKGRIETPEPPKYPEVINPNRRRLKPFRRRRPKTF